MEGGCVLSATINKFSYGTLVPRNDFHVNVQSLDYGISIDYHVDAPLVRDGKLDLVKAAVARLRGEASTGFNLFLHSEAPPGSGLGASSSLMVTLVGLLMELKNLPLTDYE